MTDRQDIWHRLKDHEASPPQEVVERLRLTLEGGGTMAGTPDMDGGAMGGMSDMDGGARFEILQHHEVAPPPILRQQIEQRVGVRSAVGGQVGVRSAVGGRSADAGRYRWYLTAAAACLVLVVAGWLVYRGGGRAALPTAVTDKGKPAQGVLRGATSKDTLAKVDTSGAVAATAVAPDPNAPAGRDGNKRPAFSIEGHAIPVTDNDLLATFTGFTYPEIPAYLTRETDRPLKIYIDQYTNLYISQAMLSMMKEMYQLLPNGKPARKARKMKRRLESWKEKDQKRFDKGNGANPLDPVDLAEFIFR